MIPKIILQLLDSSQWRPLQAWTFENRDSVTIGRSPDNDVVVADPYVSRSHAYLRFDANVWRLISVSRHLIFFDEQTLAEVPLEDGTVFRLGPHGCVLRFGLAAPQQDERATMPFEAVSKPIFKLDREKMLQEVSQIAEGVYFQELRAAVRQRREQQQMEETSR
jgi:predicted component of type VI protein secretion system